MSQRRASGYRDRFAEDAAAERYERVVYAPRSHSSAIWEQQKRLLADLIRRQRRAGRPTSVLDFACGTGRVLQLAEGLADESVGVDVSPAMLAVARRRCPRSTLVQGDLLHDRPLGSRRFDVVTAFRFFLNVEPDLRVPALRALSRHLADDGVLVANVHGHRRSLRHPVVAVRRRWPRPGNEPEMLNEMGADEFAELCHAAGLTVEARHGFGVCPPPLYRSPLQPVVRRLDERLADGRLARFGGVDLVFVCRRAPDGDAVP